jgi:hypothetical protein
MSNLRSQYLPIAFQLSNGSCKIRYRNLILLLSINLYVNHTHASIFYSQAANFPIYLINTPSPHHGYNIQNDEIWKSIIDKMKNCVHVWKSRNLTYTGKTLIVKNLLISLCGYEIEIETR